VRKYLDLTGLHYLVNTTVNLYNQRCGLRVEGKEFTVAGKKVTAGAGAEIFNDYRENGCIATGVYSHAEGYGTLASGPFSHSEGNSSVASGDFSHAEGKQTTASGFRSHSEGEGTSAVGQCSHSEGIGTSATGSYSHSEGCMTVAGANPDDSENTYVPKSCHAEGNGGIACGDYSHVEGYAYPISVSSSNCYRSISGATASHVEGAANETFAPGSHAEGIGNSVKSKNGAKYGIHIEGVRNYSPNESSTGQASHIEGESNYHLGGYQVHLEGVSNATDSDNVHIEGNTCNVASSKCAHAEGNANVIANSDNAHAEGCANRIGAMNQDAGWKTDDSGNYIMSYTALKDSDGNPIVVKCFATHAEGNNNTCLCPMSHAEGDSNYLGNGSWTMHIEGNYNTATAIAGTSRFSHIEGCSNQVDSAQISHVEGNTNEVGKGMVINGASIKSGVTMSHIEGNVNKVTAVDSCHIEGCDNRVYSAFATSVGGAGNTVTGSKTCVSGGNNTVNTQCSLVFGEYNNCTGLDSCAGGAGVSVEGFRSFGFGTGHLTGVSGIAKTAPYSFVFGDTCVAYGSNSFIFGRFNTTGTKPTDDVSNPSESSYGMAFGVLCDAAASYSLAFGSSCKIKESASSSLVFGRGNNAYCNQSFIFGSANTTGVAPTDDNPNPNQTSTTVTIGNNCTAIGYASFALGTSVKTEGANSLTFGFDSGVYGSSNNNSISVGQKCSVYSPFSLALGDACIAGVKPTSDAPSPKQNLCCYAIGSDNTATGTHSFALGGGCVATGSQSLAFGVACRADGTGSIALGSGCNVAGYYSLGVGSGVTIYSDANNSIALMSGTRVYSPDSVAIGCGSVAGDSETSAKQNQSCFALGSSCTSKGGEGSLATGYMTISSSKSQFVTGKYNKEDANNKYGFILGNGNYDSDSETTIRSNAIAIDWQGKIYVNNSETGVDVLDLLNRITALEAKVAALTS
jgi:hypothetical protein